MIGCGNSGTDFSQSPQNQDTNLQIRMTKVTYKPEKQNIHIEWVVTGEGQISNFKVMKGLGQDSFFPVSQVESGQSSFDGQVFTFEDNELIAGENLYYKVEALSNNEIQKTSGILSTQLPGARISNIVASENDATIQIFWTRESNAVAYELVRQIDNETQEVIFLSQDVSMNSFVDKNLIGNIQYTYFLNTLMPNGIRLKSLVNTSGFYKQSVFATLGTALENRVRLSLDWTKVNSPLALIVGSDNIGVAQFEMEYKPGSRIVLSYENQTFLTSPPIYKFDRAGFSSLTGSVKNLRPETISFAGPSLQQPVGRAFLVGIDDESKLVKAYGYEHDQSGVVLVWEKEVGSADDSDRKTAIAYGAGNTLVVIAAGMIRMYDQDLNAIGEVSNVLPQIPYDVVLQDNALWASLPDNGRFLKGNIQLDGVGNLIDINWQEISIPGNAIPLGIGVNSKYQIMVLDGGSGQILVYSQDGDLVTRISDVGDVDDFVHADGSLQGDLSASIVSGDGVYVIDAQNNIKFFGDSSPGASF